MLFQYHHVGKLLVNVDLDGCSPGAKCILEPGSDVAAFIEGIREDIRQAFLKRCLAVEFVDSDCWPAEIRYQCEPQIIQTKEADDAKWAAWHNAVPTKTPEEWELEKSHMQARVKAMPLRELIDEHGDRIGGTTWDELVEAELERRLEAIESKSLAS